MNKLLAGLSLALIVAPFGLSAAENPMVEGPTWAEISGDIVGDVTLQDGAALLSLDAPYRAEDAATVPVVIEQTDTATTITAMKLVVDENPAPLVAEFRFGPAMHPLKLETRVRVNQYSNLRVIADTAEGRGQIINSEEEVGGYPVQEMTRRAFDPEDWNLADMSPAREGALDSGARARGT